MAEYGSTVGSAIGGVGSSIGGLFGSMGSTVGGMVNGAMDAVSSTTPIVLAGGALLVLFAVVFLRRALR
jgi:hypothetical protein